VSSPRLNAWQDVRAEVLDRIRSRRWKPGELIPNEADLAAEFGCARATVNRALQAVADSGLLDRRRKAGTRVATHPVRKATLNIPIIRHEIEERNETYSYALQSSAISKIPNDVAERMALAADTKALNVNALHLTNDRPYVIEERWINTAAVPDILKADLSAASANEWLVANAPYTDGTITFSAMCANAEAANILGASEGDALFTIDRMTWNGTTAITVVRLTFHSGYKLKTTL